MLKKAAMGIAFGLAAIWIANNVNAVGDAVY